MKIVDLRNKSIDELKALLLTISKEQFNLRFQRAAGETPSSAKFRQLRRVVARIKTLLAEKQAKQAA